MRLDSFRPLPLLFGSVCFCLMAGVAGVFSPAMAAPASPAATALSVSPEVLVEREGKRLPLAVKDALMEKDVLVSNASGRAQIIFADDTTVSLAPNTTIRLSDFAYDETEQSFALDVVSGISRIATGEVARRKPNSFRVETPQASVGIRGTLLGVNAGAEKTTLILFETSGQGFEVTNKATGQVSNLARVGYAMDVSGAGNMERPATPAEMQSVGQGTRGAGTQTASGTGSELTPVSGLASITSPQGGQGPAGAAEDSPLIAFEDPSAIANPPLNGGGLDIALIRGTFFANDANPSAGYASVNMSFSVDGNANISDANITLSDGSGNYLAADAGSGQIASNGTFQASGFTEDRSGVTDSLLDANMSGKFESASGGKLNWDMMLQHSGFTPPNGQELIGGTDIPFNKSPE